MSRAEMDLLGWDSCDVIIVTGDAYVDHPSFGMAIVGRVLEAQGFRVGIIAQPDWHSAEAFAALGRPNLFFGVTAGNMDSMVNRYTSERRVRSDDAYTPGGRRRQSPGPLGHRLRAARARGLPGRADRDRRHRGLAAPHRAFRLLVGEGAPLGAAGCQGRPAGLRQRRATDLRDRASPGRRRGHRRDHRPARHGLRAQGRAGGLDRDRLDAPGCPGSAEPAARSVRHGRMPRPAARRRRPPACRPDAPRDRRRRWCASCGA